MITVAGKPRLNYAAMMTLPELTDVHEFRTFLDKHGYDSATLTRTLGRSRPPADGEQQQMFDDSREITTANVLIRLFLLGAPIDAATFDEFIPASLQLIFERSGLTRSIDGMVDGQVVIIPVDDMLFASDAFHILGSDDASEFVLPASTHSANFLRLLTMRDPVDTALDLGCGCGIHALFAARHSRAVVATDISPRAIAYTSFNAILNNLSNIECREGNLFEPVADQCFDLIISNPPFVISPSESFVYRDNAMELDTFCEVLVGEAPAYLNEGGHLQMLCEWVEVDGQPWQDRIAGWIRGCDAWVLHAAPLTPAAYVQQRSSDISVDAGQSGAPDTWTAYFEKHRVRAVHPGVLTLRRRDADNWIHVQNLPGDVIVPAGQAIIDGIDAVDFLESCDDVSLLEATLTLADDLSAEQMESDGKITGIYLKLNNALATDAEIDGPVAAFLNLFGGQRPVQDCISEFAATTDANAAQLQNDLLAIIRVFVSRGFLVPGATASCTRTASQIHEDDWS